VFSAEDARALLADVGAIQDEPLTDSSFLPIYALSRFARESVTVVLSGDGGDELFCGYPTFLVEGIARWFRRAPRWISAVAARLADRLRPSSRYGSIEFLLKQFFRGLPYSREIRTQLLLGGVPAWEQSRLLSSDVRAACAGFDPYDGLMTAVAEVPGLSPMERLMYQHCKFYLAGQNLVTVDRASMACGLEVRAPFLARGLVQLASVIPSEWKLRGWVTKYILKAAFRDRLPRAIADRRKQGFGVPTAAWLRGPLRDDLVERLAGDRLARHQLFDATVVRRLVGEHLAGTNDRRKLLWSLLMFEAWYDHYRPTGAA
jgi:asparagine synthase (glutamine-hydrolysing)